MSLGILLALASPARAIDRDCPKGQIWDPAQGSCIKQKAPRKSPAKKYREAITHIEGTARHPKPAHGVALLKQSCGARYAPACRLLGYLFLHGRHVKTDFKKSLEYSTKACKLKEPEGCLGASDVFSRGLLTGKVDHKSAIPLLESACALKSGRGCWELADKYWRAQGVRYNYKKGSELYKQAFALFASDCDNKIANSCHRLGLAYSQGKGTVKNPKSAFTAFVKGCDAGSGDACYQVGRAYRHGDGTYQSTRKAVEYYDRACFKYDSATACHDVGVYIAQAAKATERTAAENKRLMEYGDRACALDKAQCDLIGYLYATGLGGVKDDRVSVKWYHIGCDNGSGASCMTIGTFAKNGTGMNKDGALSVRSYDKACKLSWAEACTKLGEYYFNGTYVAKNLSTAFQKFKDGCYRDHADGCHWVAWALQQGKDGTGQKKAKDSIYWYKKACGMSWPAACVDLGHLYRKGGNDVPKNPDEAQIWYDKGCKGDHKNGCLGLGDMHYNGDGVPKDDLKAGLAYLRACALGVGQKCFWVDGLLKNGKANATQRKNAMSTLDNACNVKRVAEACLALADIYARGGYIGEKNGTKAFDLFDRECKRGSKIACVQTGHMYASGIGRVQDLAKANEIYTQQCNGAMPAACHWLGINLYKQKKYDQSAPLFQRACNDGEAIACMMVGWSYYSARGFDWDLDKSREAYEKGCKLGNTTACNNLGEMYEYGIGVDKDLKKAAELFHKGCTPTGMDGCTNLGRFLEKGIEVDKDPDRAEKEFTRVCEAENPWGEACRALADYYKSTGKGSASRIAKLYQKALSLTTKDAETNPYSMYVLGKMYLEGIAVVKDPKKASANFRRACDGYDPLGCEQAGLMLMGERGVDANYEEAAVRFQRACAAGLDDACKQAEVAKERLANPQPDKDPDHKKLPLEPKKKAGCCSATTSGRDLGGIVVLGAAVLLIAVRRRRYE